jgi:hypothetical protein
MGVWRSFCFTTLQIDGRIPVDTSLSRSFETMQRSNAVKRTTHQRIRLAMESKREIERRAYDIIDAHPHFHGRAARFELTCGKDVLVVRGMVRTFYLKQMLQTVLKDVCGVGRIDNQVTVMSDYGLCGFGDGTD